MVLDSKRNSVEFILTPIAKKLSRCNPNTLSWIAFALAVLAGIVIYCSYGDWWFVLLPLAALVVILSGLFDAIDGKVARMTFKSSRRGDLLDHVLDRYADVIMIGAVAVSAWCDPYIGILAIIGVLLTSYMGTQCQAMGAGRLYSGMLGRADRVVLLTLAPIAQTIMMVITGGEAFIHIGDYSITIFGIVMLWFAIIGNITAVQRAFKIWKMLG